MFTLAIRKRKLCNVSEVQLNKYETAPNFIQLTQNLYIGLFVDLAEFTCFYQFLHDVIIKLFCFDRCQVFG